MHTPDASTPGAPDLDQAYRVLLIICLALVFGVVAFAGVAAFLSSSGAFPGFLGFSPLVRTGIAVGFLVLLVGAYPLQSMAGGPVPVDDAASALQAHQTKTIVGMAVREFVGIAGGVLILLSGDLVLGGTLVGLTVITMLLALPRKEEMRAAMRRSG